MAYPSLTGASELSHTWTPRQAEAWADSEGKDPTALTEQGSAASGCGLGPGPDVVYESFLIQIRYDEHLAQQELRELFERGELECLGG
jgi:hypothetical protein